MGQEETKDGRGTRPNAWGQILGRKSPNSGLGSQGGNPASASTSGGGNQGSGGGNRGNISQSQSHGAEKPRGSGGGDSGTIRPNQGNAITSQSTNAGHQPHENGNRGITDSNGGSGRGDNPNGGGSSSGSEGRNSGGNPIRSDNSGASTEENGLGNVPAVTLEIDGKPKGGKAGSVGKSSPSKKKKSNVGYLNDKELISKLSEAIKLGFEVMDKGNEYLLGIDAGIWLLSDDEAETLARVFARRADAGDKVAIQTINNLLEKLDYIQAAMIVVPRAASTIKEVVNNGGIRPIFARSRETNEQ